MKLAFDSNGNLLAKCRRIHCKHTVEKFRETLCQSCKARDKAAKNKVKRNQRAIGIKQTRRKNRVIWKDQIDNVPCSNLARGIVYARREASKLLIKHSLAEDWQPITHQKFSALERKNNIIWNPEDNRSQLRVG